LRPHWPRAEGRPRQAAGPRQASAAAATQGAGCSHRSQHRIESVRQQLTGTHSIQGPDAGDTSGSATAACPATAAGNITAADRRLRRGDRVFRALRPDERASGVIGGSTVGRAARGQLRSEAELLLQVSRAVQLASARVRSDLGVVVPSAMAACSSWTAPRSVHSVGVSARGSEGGSMGMGAAPSALERHKHASR
jgi:hypothetical protein